MVVIPQKNRRGKIIIDLSFPVYLSKVKRGSKPIQSRVNETTECLAPDAPVKEIDNVFRRVLKFIDSLAKGEVVMFEKI